jgi:hypothetical protein
MFGRVSTVDLGQYANNPELVAYIAGNGVFAGKKWTGSYGPYSETDLTPQVEAGWMEFADDSYIYPEYSFEDLGLPDWVNCKGTEGGLILDDAPRFLIGDGTGAIGPFTLQEALYFYSVVKKIKPNQTHLNLITGNAAGTVATVTINESSFDPNNYGGTGSTAPVYLFIPHRKNYTTLYAQGSNNNRTKELYTYAFAQGQVYATQFYYKVFYGGIIYNTATIVIDIDKPEDYYICNVGYNLTANADASATAYKIEDNSTKGSAYSYSSSHYSLSPIKSAYYIFSFDEETGESTLTQTLSQVGDTWTDAAGGTLTYVSATMNYKVGEITKTNTLYGVQSFSNNTGSGGEDPPSIPSTSVSVPLPTSFEVSASEYWPYKNANGEPVYNTTTGAIVDPVKPPIP